MSCDRCNGTGTISYRTLGDGVERSLGYGVTVTDMGGWATRACRCVRDLPATDGRATWWESETIYSTVVGVPIGDRCVEINADCEVPRGDDGRRYHRTAENAYYPPLVTVEGADTVTLHADTAREFASALIAAADACEKANKLARGPRRAGPFVGRFHALFPGSSDGTFGIPTK